MKDEMTSDDKVQFEHDMKQFEQAGKKNKSVFMTTCGIIAAAFLCIGLAVAASFGAVFFGVNSMKSTAVYQQALTAAVSNSEVVDILGEPIKTGLFPSGSINVNDDAGDAQFAIPLSGPNGEGTIYLEATRTTGDWKFHVLEVEIDGRSGRINLLSESGR